MHDGNGRGVAERWFAGERRYDRKHRPRHYTVRLLGQPETGFEKVSEVMEWLEAEGRIKRVVDPDEGDFLNGWGDPYCALSSSRGDPWEKPDV